MKLFTIDELKELQDVVCKRIWDRVVNIENNDCNMHGYKGLIKESFTTGDFNIKYEIEIEADGLNSERYTPNVTCEGEIKIFKKDKEIQAFAIDKGIDY